MINGIGVVGWGVGGIEAEAGDARPAGLLPDARRGRLRAHRRAARRRAPRPTSCSPSPRCCARKRWSASSSSSSAKAPRSLSVPDRATIANMAPEYGATMGFFPVDDKTIEYFEGTGRTKSEIEFFEAYFKAQGLFGMPARRRDRLHPGRHARPRHGDAEPGRPEAPAGPHRDRQGREQVHRAVRQPPTENGFNQPAAQLLTRHHVRRSRLGRRRRQGAAHALGHPGRAALRRGNGGQQADPRRRPARSRAEAAGARDDDRQRRRADRRHHLVHQHLATRA